MRFPQCFPLVLFLCALFTACSADKHLFTNGPIPSRKAVVDHGRSADPSTSIEKNVDRTKRTDASDQTTLAPNASLSATLELADAVTVSHTVRKQNVPVVTSTSRVGSSPIAEVISSDPPYRPQEEDENLMPRKKLNFLAIPAFTFALGTVALGLFTTSTIAVLVAAVLTILLAGLSIRRIRSREQGGKGFALLALILAILALLATAIAIAVVGFV